MDRSDYDTPIEIARKLTKDLMAASRLMDRAQARYLVDNYYAIQAYRISTANQLRSLGAGEPGRVLQWCNDEMTRVENAIKRALGAFAHEYSVGQWMLSQVGIGPVISAGLLSHLDVSKCKTAGHFWRFAGLDPTMVWEKGKPRPWNAALRCLCAFKMGECFVKTQNRDGAVYGQLYRQRKDAEIAASGEGKFKALAAERAEKVGKSTVAYKHYKDGTLPPGHLHARARRFAVKIFLSHLHHVMYFDYFREDPPVPYVFEHCPGDHRHFIDIPNWPWPMTGKSLRDLKEGERVKRKTRDEVQADALAEDDE